MLSVQHPQMYIIKMPELLLFVYLFIYFIRDLDTLVHENPVRASVF